ncbi:MAG: ABC transporter ATP-binding protein [Candidatus Krumholzibacteriota bacterium]|nr:ABC transporter ATP-binding protein [Candidatus Krumholzibacteriota bacterium]
MSHAIEINNLTKKYKQSSGGNGQDISALEGIDLTIESGEFVTIFGPNGCGKTTLLLCVAGIEEPSTGSILINDRSPHEALTGFVFQNYREALLPWRSCLDNIAFPLEISGIDKKESRNRAEQIVEDLYLNIDLRSYPYQQSGGQQQLVAIARALVSDPDVLVMDEPLSALDLKARFRMRATIEEIWQRTNKTTLHVSHDVEEAVYLSDKIVVLSERPGKILRVIPNTLERPRDRTAGSVAYNEMRNKVLEIFQANEEIQ